MTPVTPPLTPLRVADVPPQAWRNGGGQTRELLGWPAGADWRLRISLADIESDGPFSAFPGVQRWFAVIEGAGVVLALAAGERRLTAASDPLCFDGADAPGCRLIDGPTRDLNLMLRGGARGRMIRVVNDSDWHEPWPWRACFTSGAARWSGGAGRGVDLGPNTLLGGVGSAPCRLVAADPAAPMFWLGADIDLTESAR